MIFSRILLPYNLIILANKNIARILQASQSKQQAMPDSIAAIDFLSDAKFVKHARHQAIIHLQDTTDFTIGIA